MEIIDKHANYCILDAARILGEMSDVFDFGNRIENLYSGNTAESLAEVAPYLAECSEGCEFNRWLIDKGWGDSRGIFIHSDVSFEELRKHFRNFLKIKDEGDQILYFRFYDPRVLRVFLPTCDAQQLETFFGPVKKYIMEDDDSSIALVFSLKNSKLHKDTIDLTKYETMPGIIEHSESLVEEKNSEIDTIV